jgi:prepilin-type N-terminal cleavage/methylation domain-containing protein
MPHRQIRPRAFTTVELLVVIAIVGILLAFLFPALLGVRRSALKTKSMNNMRQINLWMNLYSEDNLGIVLPSTFDNRGMPYPGLTRSIPEYHAGLTLSMGEEHHGTWSDILWTENELGFTAEFIAVQDVASSDLEHSYVYDSPDTSIYREFDGEIENVLRSHATNATNSQGELVGEEYLPRPFGTGAREKGYAGYFAANDIFNTDAASPAPFPLCYANNSQIRVPDRMMYLIDSKAGEIIQPLCYAYLNPPSGSSADGDVQAVNLADGVYTGEVDFRYGNTALSMLMDGHIESVGNFASMEELENDRGIHVFNPFTSTP